MQVVTRIFLIMIVIQKPSHNMLLKQYSIMMMIVLVILDLLLVAFRKEDLKATNYTLNKKTLIRTMQGLLLAAGFIVIEALILNLNKHGASSITTTTNNTLNVNLMYVVLPLLLAPIAEEITFRQSLTSFLKQHMNIVIATLISSLVFGLFHYISDGQLLIYVIMGIYMQLIYNKWHSISLNVLVHLLVNSLPIVVMLVNR